MELPRLPLVHSPHENDSPSVVAPNYEWIRELFMRVVAAQAAAGLMAIDDQVTHRREPLPAWRGCANCTVGGGIRSLARSRGNRSAVPRTQRRELKFREMSISPSKRRAVCALPGCECLTLKTFCRKCQLADPTLRRQYFREIQKRGAAKRRGQPRGGPSFCQHKGCNRVATWPVSKKRLTKKQFCDKHQPRPARPRTLGDILAKPKEQR